MKRVFAILRSILAISLFLAVPNAYRHFGHAFRLAKCYVYCPYNPDWETSVQNLEIVTQPFSYLGKGKQCYVFVSEDQKYVLKLFKGDFSKIQIGQEIKKWIKKKSGKRFKESIPRKERLYRSFDSCALCFAKAPLQTGLVYVHLNPKSGAIKPIKIKDRFGFTHQIDPAKYRFIIQKKADPIYLVMNEENLQKFNNLLDELGELGFYNLDRTWKGNFGLVDDRAIQMDVGDIVFLPERSKENAAHFKAAFQHWLSKK